MKSVIEIIRVCRAGDLNRLAEEPIRLEAGAGMMPLSVEVCGGMLGHPVVAVSHHYLLNGDVMWDPTTEHLVRPGGWVPLYFEQSMPPYRSRAARPDGRGGLEIDRRAMASLAEFIALWDSNLETYVEAARRLMAR